MKTKREAVRLVEEAMSLALATQDRIHGMYYEQPQLMSEREFNVYNESLELMVRDLRDTMRRRALAEGAEVQ